MKYRILFIYLFIYLFILAELLCSQFINNKNSKGFNLNFPRISVLFGTGINRLISLWIVNMLFKLCIYYTPFSELSFNN